MIVHSQFRERIHYLGYVTLSDKLLLLRKASVFMFPSWYEGFGLPPLEAMASGCPVVSSSASSLSEVVSDSGILIEPHQTEDFIHSVDTILRDTSLRNKLIEKGRKRAKEFSWDVTAQKTLDILKSYI